jgi:polyisoprenoid-binding protein YceI
MHMNRFAAALIFVCLPAAALAAPETYSLDPNHTNVEWHASHFGFSTPSGKFANVEGKLVLDEAAPAKSSVEAVIWTDSLITGIPKFDEHLKSLDFLNVEKYAKATFKSTRVEMTGKHTAKVHGQFTLLGVTMPIVLDVKLNKIGTSMAHKVKSAGFSATTTLKRSQYGMTFGLPGVPDEVLITIESEANLIDAPKS